MKHRVLNVTEFKASCLALLDDIGKRGGTLTITKRGKPLATVRPAEDLSWRSPEGSWSKKISLNADPLDVDTSEFWEISDKRAPDRR